MSLFSGRSFHPWQAPAFLQGPPLLTDSFIILHPFLKSHSYTGRLTLRSPPPRRRHSDEYCCNVLNASYTASILFYLPPEANLYLCPEPVLKPELTARNPVTLKGVHRVSESGDSLADGAWESLLPGCWLYFDCLYLLLLTICLRFSIFFYFLLFFNGLLSLYSFLSFYCFYFFTIYYLFTIYSLFYCIPSFYCTLYQREWQMASRCPWRILRCAEEWGQHFMRSDEPSKVKGMSLTWVLFEVSQAKVKIATQGHLWI